MTSRASNREHRGDSALATDDPFPADTARSKGFRRALNLLESFALSDRATVTLEGESGTGKTFLARHLHRRSPRASKAFCEVNLASIDDAIATSDLFGHVPGAFTGAIRERTGLILSAHGGTLFLDELGQASGLIQQRLLATIERRVVRPLGSDRDCMVDLRIITASNIPLAVLVQRGTLLHDLLPRLGTFLIRVPPLRERRDDIPGLARMFLQRHAPDFGYPEAPPLIDANIMLAFTVADWPNNVRQLDHTIRRLLVAGAESGDRLLTLGHCQDELEWLRTRVRGTSMAPIDPSIAEQMRREVGTVTEAAKRLGVSRSTVHRHLRKHPIALSPAAQSAQAGTSVRSTTVECDASECSTTGVACLPLEDLRL